SYLSPSLYYSLSLLDALPISIKYLLCFLICSICFAYLSLTIIPTPDPLFFSSSALDQKLFKLLLCLTINYLSLLVMFVSTIPIISYSFFSILSTIDSILCLLLFKLLIL